MLGKRPRPMISKLSALLVSGNRAGFLDVGSSPRSPFELKIQSPRSLKHYDVGGVGLGIVAALDHGGGCENLTKFSVCSSSLKTSSPIPVGSGKNRDRCNRGGGDFEEMESLEDYTYVTCHAGPNKTSTKVYYDGVHQTNTKNGFHSKNNNNKSPKTTFVDDFSAYPTSDFLSSCHLCSKKLHGKDIYMYRGEKAFCSTECRSRQIMMDERKEQCRSDVSSSPYTRDQIFSTGILAI
ncbi:hypothetical protein Ddye_020261 [Dipteronia dyeriana]|uniref:FLZ-type domain-containing protein n=1 Tax=Dipteronia dyeriana TaxID=168575 RepID=A0AAD9U080_9ROSI|nr:hypothetical protein Ddye_020261 [Dipteronia dyeriana]